MLYTFIRLSINLFLFIFWCFEKLLNKQNMIILYFYLYFQFLFNAFNYAIHAHSYLFGCMFFAWLPFFFYLIELKFCKKQHGVYYYIGYLFIITIGYNILQTIPALLYTARFLRFYLFWLYIYTVSNIVLVVGLSYLIFIIEYFEIPKHTKNLILKLCWLIEQSIITTIFLCLLSITYVYKLIRRCVSAIITCKTNNKNKNKK